MFHLISSACKLELYESGKGPDKNLCIAPSPCPKKPEKVSLKGSLDGQLLVWYLK